MNDMPALTVQRRSDDARIQVSTNLFAAAP